MKGLANIPILIALALIIGITPLAINQVQKNQNLQNHAAGSLFTSNTVPCTELYSAQASNCSSLASKITGKTVPCIELSAAIKTYCYNKITTPIPIPIPTTKISACVVGQTKCIGRMVFKCNGNNWLYSQICKDTCVSGRCITKDTL